MVWLPDGENISKISLFVLTQLTNMTDRRTDRQTPHADIYRAYAYAPRDKNRQIATAYMHFACMLCMYASNALKIHKNVLHKDVYHLKQKTKEI